MWVIQHFIYKAAKTSVVKVSKTKKLLSRFCTIILGILLRLISLNTRTSSQHISYTPLKFEVAMKTTITKLFTCILSQNNKTVYSPWSVVLNRLLLMLVLILQKRGHRISTSVIVLPLFLTILQYSCSCNN